MDALLVVDMQVGMHGTGPQHDLPGVVGRINQLAAMVRAGAGHVIWIRHRGRAGDDFAPGTPGWGLLPELDRRDADLVVDKTLNDAFAGTHLQSMLQQAAADRVIVTGWATDFCVDATVRSAVAHDHHVVAVSDAHTVSDRPHLDAAMVIRHHNWVWSNLLTHRSIAVAATADLLRAAATR